MTVKTFESMVEPAASLVMVMFTAIVTTSLVLSVGAAVMFLFYIRLRICVIVSCPVFVPMVMSDVT